MQYWAHNMSFDVGAAAGFAYKKTDNPGHHDLTIAPNFLVRFGPMVLMVMFIQLCGNIYINTCHLMLRLLMDSHIKDLIILEIMTSISPNFLVRSGPMVSMVSGSLKSILLAHTSFNMLSSSMVREPYMGATWSTP